MLWQSRSFLNSHFSTGSTSPSSLSNIRPQMCRDLASFITAWPGSPASLGFLRRRRWLGTGKSCINKDPKSSLEKPNFSHLNNEHKASRPQPLFFIYSLVIHTPSSPHETTLHHITASRLPSFTTLHHITVSVLLPPFNTSSDHSLRTSLIVMPSHHTILLLSAWIPCGSNGPHFPHSSTPNIYQRSP